MILSLAVADVRALPPAHKAREVQKVRVMSDIHAGSCWQANQTILFEFLEQTAKDDVDILVLNGDVYDFWLVPLHQSPPSFNASVENGLDPSLGFDMARFHKLLQGAAKSVISLHEDIGNHDMWLSGDLAQKAFGDTVMSFDGEAVENHWGVRFEHGHMHTLYNSPIPGSNKMPMGYFITRAVATYSCAAQSRFAGWLQSVCKDILGTSVINSLAIEALKPTAMFKDLLEHIMHTATDFKLGNLNVPVVGVASAHQIPVAGATFANYTLAHFIEDYADTMERFVSAHGAAGVATMLNADVLPKQLAVAAGMGSVNESVIVLGHTHVPQIQVIQRQVPHRSRTPDVLVANAGAWVPDDFGNPQHSYADLTIDDVIEDYPECYSAANGADYRGMASTTETGVPCVAWGSYTERSTPYLKAFGNVAFCRNLGDNKKPWCYTGMLPTSWANCAVGPPAVHCPQERLRGAVAVNIFSFGKPEPLGTAVRKASTGSSWKVTKAIPDEQEAVVV